MELRRRLKAIIQKIRQPIDKAITKVVEFVAGKVRILIGNAKNAITEGETESPEKTRKLSLGLGTLKQERQKHLKDNKISRDNAEKVAITVKKSNPVFKSINVVDGVDTWDYEYEASPKRREVGYKQSEKSDELDNSQVEKYNRRKHYGNTPTESARKATFLRDNYTCQYCGRKVNKNTQGANSGLNPEADHTPSLKRHYEKEGYKMNYEERVQWANDIRNLKTACRDCNRSKKEKAYPAEWKPDD